MSFVAVAVAGAAVVGSVVSSNAAKSAAKKSAQAQTDNSEANIALAREERAKNEALFSQYLGDENKARAYADALTYGSGTYPGPNNTTITISRAQVEQEIANTPLARLAETTYAERETQAAQSYADENTQAQSSYGGFRDRADRDLAARNTDAGARRADTEGIADDGFGASMSEADRVRAERSGQAQTGLDARYSEADAAYGARTTEAGRARTDRETAAANTRTGMRGVGDENYAATLSLAEQDYLKRQGFTDAEITAWEAKALDAKDNAINAAASRLGVSGQTGRTTRTIADTEQNYAMDRALYEGERRRDDYEPYSAARLNADAQRGDTYLEAERGYADGMGRAVESYAGDTSRAIDLRAGAREGAYDEYDADLEAMTAYYNGDRNAAMAALQQQRQAASQGYYSDRSNAYDQYSEADAAAYGAMSEAQRQALLRKNSSRASNTDQRAGDKANSYAAFSDDLAARQSRGYGARANIASGGQAYADTAINQNNRAADAASASYARQGEIQQQLYGDLASAAGSVWGAINNRKGK
jgi:hypothetical protein